MEELKYTEIIRRNREYRRTATGPKYRVLVLANIVVLYLKEILEYALAEAGVNAEVTLGGYDAIVQESPQAGGHDAVIVFWELANLVDGLQYRADMMVEERLDELLTHAASQVDLALGNLAAASLVLFNRFTDTAFAPYGLRPGAAAQLAARLNGHLASRARPTLLQVDLDRILIQVGLREALSLRDYYSSKSLYSVAFFKAYAQQIRPGILAACGKVKKVLVFDCDNTLWDGILGEDGMEGIAMSARDARGAPYEEVQFIAKALAHRGAILGLCSKNNEADVDEVERNHPDFHLRDGELVVRRVNWGNKADNLREIAAELNVGLDSLVFVDDSAFEVDLVRGELPEVTVFRVPENRHDYPTAFRKLARLFFNLSETAEDLRKSSMYREQQARRTLQREFTDLEGYLRELQLAVEISVNDRALVPRAAQMTQKTNQFNLTTRRYTEQDISQFIDQGDLVVCLAVKDRFGDSGVSGLAIVRLGGAAATIDSLLMSCRILGRNLECVFVDSLLSLLRARGVERIGASYLPTHKNQQVADFYERAGFGEPRIATEGKYYTLVLRDHQSKDIDYISVSIRER